jgi:hypothetical protein
MTQQIDLPPPTWRVRVYGYADIFYSAAFARRGLGSHLDQRGDIPKFQI